MSGVRRVIEAAFLAASLVACGGGGGGSGGGDGGARVDTEAALRTACQALQWGAAAAAQPLDRVIISNLQGPILTSAIANPAGLHAELLGADGNVAASIPVFAAADSSDRLALSVVAPAHPQSPFQGGAVALRLVVGDDRCAAQSLTVGALPEPADPQQTLAGVIASLEGLVVRAAESFGYYDIDALRAAADDFVARADDIAASGDLGVPAQLIPLLIAVDGIDVLRALNAEGGLSDADRRLFAAVLEGLGDQGYSAEAESLLSTLGQRTTPTPAVGPGNGSVTTTLSALSTGPSGACAQAIAGDNILIDSAPALDHYMEEQAATELAMDPTASLQGAALGAAEAVLPIAGILSGGAATAAGAMLYVHKLIQLFTVNTLPSTFTELEPRVLNPGAAINEDFEAAGGDPRWDDFEATAESRGMDLAGPTLEGIQTLLGAVGWAKGANAAGGSLRDDIAQFGADQIEGAARDAVWDVWGTLEQLASAGGCFQLASQTFGPIDITGREYSKASVDGSAFTLADGGRNDTLIDLVHTGFTNLTLEPREDRFGGRSGSWAERIHVRQIVLEPRPPVFFASTLGTNELFGVYPRYAENPVALSPTVVPNPGVGSIVSPPSFNGSRFDFTYRTPSDESQYPVILEITAQGALPSGSPTGPTERTAQIEVSADARVVVSPETACIEPGESRRLTAQILGRSAPNFDWQVTAGRGSLAGARAGNDATVENNTYLAPGGFTDATIRVTHTDSASGEQTSAEIAITVGDCDARVFVHGVLTASASAENDEAAYNSDDLKDLPDPVAPPTIPATLWLSRTEPFQSGPLNATTTYTFYNSGAQCDTASFVSCDQDNVAGGGDTPAGADANVSYEVDARGTASFAFGYSGNQRCLEHPVTGDVHCSESSASAPWDVAFYVDLAAAGEYQLNIELACQESGQAIGGTAFGVQIYRFAGGDGEQGDAMPVNGYQVDEINGVAVFSPDGYTKYPTNPLTTTLPYAPYTSIYSANACENGTVSFSQLYELAGPVVDGDPDLVYVVINALTVAQPLVNDNADPQRQAIHPFTPPPADPTFVEQLEPQPGSYMGEVSITGQASFRRTN